MKVLFDTSVLVAAMVEGHPSHERAWPWLQQAKTGKVQGVVAAHSLAELYAVLTVLPLQEKISPEAAWKLIRENLLKDFKVITLSQADYRVVLQRLMRQELIGGVVYDALIAQAARKARVDRLITLNVADFRRVWPEGKERISKP